MMWSSLLAVFSSFALTALAANQVVKVGPNGSVTFSPTSVDAAVGDTIEFQFESNVRLSPCKLT
jgi:plastocyanin